jgi:ferredoxin-nitrite reductase
MQPFTEEQKQYLQGFMSGVVQRGGLPFAGQAPDGRITDESVAAERDLADPGIDSLYGTPVDELCRQERIKLEHNPHEMWDTVLANAKAGRMPEGDDVFRYKAFGLFNVAPVQDGFMLRCRIPGCMLRADQLRSLADLADAYGGGYGDVTTRGNMQLREVKPRHAADVLVGLYDIGLTSKGAGADNLRNITASPTAGFDAQELFDVRPLVRAMHHYILHSPDLYGLPRKFNIAFDSGGRVSVAADTNDLGFMAVQVDEGAGVDPGVYFRVELGGVTGHGSFAQDTGLMVRPEQCIAVAASVVRVYLENGDRTNRKKARLKYLLEAWGVEKFMSDVQARLTFDLIPFPRERCAPRLPVVRHSHVGFHAQKQAGRRYIGIVVPVGRLKADQMRSLADIAARYGSGDVRLTIFQNVLIPDIAEDDEEVVRRAIRDIGFHYEIEDVRSGLVACTGAAGCPYGNTHTKEPAVALGDYLAEHVPMDQPINIHFTGCPNSCAQHYCGDIGLLGVPVKLADGTRVDGCTIVLGGGMDHDQGLARELVRSVPFDDVPPFLARVLTTYLREREGDESFAAFTRRHDEATLKNIFLKSAEVV